MSHAKLRMQRSGSVVAPCGMESMGRPNCRGEAIPHIVSSEGVNINQWGCEREGAHTSLLGGEEGGEAAPHESLTNSDQHQEAKELPQ
eukprot:505572-Amphidinium_carterae.7